MDHSLVWDPLAMLLGTEPEEHDAVCRGTTKSNTRCKNRIKRCDLKEGRQELRSLAKSPLNLTNLQTTLVSIAENFLCKRWHRQSQAKNLGKEWFEVAQRSQRLSHVYQRRSASHLEAEAPHRLAPARRRSTSRPEQNTEQRPARRERIGQMALVEDQAATSIQLGTNPVTSPREHQSITVAMLRRNQVPWEITDRSPAVLSVANDAAGQHILNLRSFEPSPYVKDDDDDEVECCICLDKSNDEPVMLQCPSCSFHVHLHCMENWLKVRRSGQHPSCPQCLSREAFDALFRGARDLSVAAETAPERVPLERDSGISTTNLSDGSSEVSLGTSPSPAPRAAAHGMEFHGELRRHGVRRSARLARRPDPFRVTQPGTARRSARVAQRNAT